MAKMNPAGRKKVLGYRSIYLKFNLNVDKSTVVPATAGPLGERPPALAGHFCDVPTTLPC